MYTLEQVSAFRKKLSAGRFSLPKKFLQVPIRVLQKNCNGIGPEAFPTFLRKLISHLFRIFELAAIVHDYEFSLETKSYGHFTVANFRLSYNSCVEATKTREFGVAILFGILCQIFGYKAYKAGTLNH